MAEDMADGNAVFQPKLCSPHTRAAGSRQLFQGSGSSVQRSDCPRMTQRSRRKTPEQDAIEHIILGRDKPFLDTRYINTFKGSIWWDTRGWDRT
ncbi:hypothetical protein NQZ68_015893 [Dissostichus eleginoides]|nr:hypothetical protein NQZ68_015893 [Dissostichus eleginoides]